MIVQIVILPLEFLLKIPPQIRLSPKNYVNVLTDFLKIYSDQNSVRLVIGHVKPALKRQIIALLAMGIV